MMTFLDLQQECKRRATRDQSGGQFDSAVNNAINMSLLRVAREAAWRVLRRTATLETKKKYTTGTGSGVFTSGSNQLTMTGANFLTDAVEIGRRMKLGGSGEFYTITQITSDTTCNIDKTYNSASITAGSYSILGQENYTLPVQCSHRMFMWHREYGYPYKMGYVTSQDFKDKGIIDTTEAIPTHYRMWGEDMTIREMITESNIVCSSTNTTSDTAVNVSIFGTVAGYPDSEVIALDGTDATDEVFSAKVYSSIERISKDASTTGRVIVTGSGINGTINYTLGVIPTGDTTAGVLYKKIRLYPLPNTTFPLHIWYYKDPYRLVGDGDIHELGQEFDEAIILRASAMIKYETDQKEGDKFVALYTNEIRNLRKTNMDKIDFFPKLRKPKEERIDLLVTDNLLFRQIGVNYGPTSRRR